MELWKVPVMTGSNFMQGNERYRYRFESKYLKDNADLKARMLEQQHKHIVKQYRETVSSPMPGETW